MLEPKSKDRFHLDDKFVLHQIPELGKYWAFNIENGDHFQLNEVSMFILEQLRENPSFNELLQKLLNEYDAKETQIHEDLKVILTQMVDEGLISYTQGEE